MRKNVWVFSILMIGIVGLLTSDIQPVPYAEGHGLGRDESEPRNVGDRIAFLRAHISPEMKRVDELRDITLTMELVDAQTRQNIPGVAYHLIIQKFIGDEVLLNETFHIMGDEDRLIIKFETTESGDVVVRGQKMGETLGYMAVDDLVVEGPIFVKAGLYRFIAEVVAMEGETLGLHEIATFEVLITLAELTSYTVNYNDREYELEVISYFDNIVDFNFDPDTMSIKMLMPFNWDRNFVEQIPLLHAEIFIPKEFSELAGREFVGTINGIEDPIFVDRAPPEEVVIHYMTPNRRMLNIADTVMQQGLRDDVVEFGLIATGIAGDENGVIVAPDDGAREWSPIMETTTSGGSILVQVQWSPITIVTEEDVTFRLNFKDPVTREDINIVRYDIMLYDPDGEHIDASHRSRQSSETQTYVFYSEGSFTLLLLNVNNSGERAEFQLTVVPEFPVAMLILAAIVGASIVLTRNKL